MAKHRTGYLFKRGNNFYVSWRIAGKPFTRALRDDQGKPVTTRRQAEEARLRLMAPFAVADEASALEAITAKLDGRKAELARWEDQQNPPLPVTKAWIEYQGSPNRPDSGESTLRQYEFQFGQFTRWIAEKHPDRLILRDVTKEIAEEYAATLNHGRLSPNTYNKHLNLLTLVFRVLKAKARLVENPWAEIQRKRAVAHSRRELTVDELRKVCESAEGELRGLLALGVYTGLRLGDCATLRWAEVDLPHGIIRRIPAKTARRNPKPVIIPIHPVLRDILSARPVDERAEHVLPETAVLYQQRSDAVTDRVQAHFKACSINPHRPGTGKDHKRAVVEVGFHSLRHTFVSLCRESNAPLAVVESIVGHSNPAMTRHYTHVGEMAAGRAVAALPAVIGEGRSQPPAARDPDVLLRQVVTILEDMAPGNWRERKGQLLALLNPSNGDGQPRPLMEL